MTIANLDFATRCASRGRLENVTTPEEIPEEIVTPPENVTPSKPISCQTLGNPQGHYTVFSANSQDFKLLTHFATNLELIAGIQASRMFYPRSCSPETRLVQKKPKALSKPYLSILKCTWNFFQVKQITLVVGGTSSLRLSLQVHLIIVHP
jgi:hypothetical protein